MSIVPTKARVKPLAPLLIEMPPYMMLFLPKDWIDLGTYHKGRPTLAFICRMILDAADMFLAGILFANVNLLTT